MKSLAKLREQSADFLEALDESPAMDGFAGLLRDLVDTRSRSDKIRAGIRVAAGRVLTDRIREIHSPRAWASMVASAMRSRTPEEFGLDHVPDMRTIRAELKSKLHHRPAMSPSTTASGLTSCST